MIAVHNLSRGEERHFSISALDVSGRVYHQDAQSSIAYVQSGFSVHMSDFLNPAYLIERSGYLGFCLTKNMRFRAILVVSRSNLAELAPGMDVRIETKGIKVPRLSRSYSFIRVSPQSPKLFLLPVDGHILTLTCKCIGSRVFWRLSVVNI